MAGDDQVVIRYSRRWVAAYLGIGAALAGVELTRWLSGGSAGLPGSILATALLWIGAQMASGPMSVVEARGFSFRDAVLGRRKWYATTGLRTDGEIFQYQADGDWQRGFRRRLAHPADWAALERWLADRA